jgi:hypothetical protein
MKWLSWVGSLVNMVTSISAMTLKLKTLEDGMYALCDKRWDLAIKKNAWLINNLTTKVKLFL